MREVFTHRIHKTHADLAESAETCSGCVRRLSARKLIINKKEKSLSDGETELLLSHADRERRHAMESLLEIICGLCGDGKVLVPLRQII